MLNIAIDKYSEYSVFVKVSFENADVNKFIHELLSIYCFKKHIEPISITVKWAYKGKLSKTLKIKPKMQILINPQKYKDLFGVFKQLLDGKYYKFANKEEWELFTESARDIVKKFIKDHLENNELLSPLCYFHDRELGREEKEELQNKINNMGEVCELIQQIVYKKKKFEI